MTSTLKKVKKLPEAYDSLGDDASRVFICYSRLHYEHLCSDKLSQLSRLPSLDPICSMR